MADDVHPQQEGIQTLHLRLLRIQWQVVTLQLIGTIALLWMYLKMVDLYIVDSIEHAMAIGFFDAQLQVANLEMPLPAWLTGEEAIGLGRFYPIMVLSIVIGGGIAALTFQNPVLQRRIRLGLLLVFVLWLFGPFMLKWLFANFGKGNWWIPPDDAVESLFKGVILVLEVVLIGLYIIPLDKDSTASSGGIHQFPFPKFANNHFNINGPNSHNTNTKSNPKRILRCKTGF
jgi:hypothetical protein